jgi:hypothetical protein
LVFWTEKCGRRKAPSKDFVAGGQGILANSNAGIFGGGGGSKSEAILTHNICFARKYKKNFCCGNIFAIITLLNPLSVSWQKGLF